MVVRTHYRRPRRHGSRLYIALCLFGCIVIGYHMVVGFVSNHHFYSGESHGHGKGGMYSAGRMDALMERQDGVQGTLRQDTPERLHQDGRDTTRSAVKSSIMRHDHVDETRGKKNPVPVMVSPAAQPQPPKSPARSKEEPPAIQSTKQYSSKRIHEGKEDMHPPSQRSVGAKKKIQPASCRIHVWDAERKAPGLGFSACNISDVWPFDHPGSGIDGMYRTAHQNAPHAIGYWLAEAVKKSALYEENFDRADLILLNTHCYESWYYILQNRQADVRDGALDPINEVSLQISKILVEGLMTTTQFVRSKGKKFVLVRPTLGAPPGVMLDTCAKFKSSFIVATERGSFCDNDRDRAFRGDSVILPMVAEGEKHKILPLEKRDTMLYIHIPCHSKGNTKSPGMVLLDSISNELKKTNNKEGIVVDYMEDSCKAMASSGGRASMIDRMKRSRYCAILPSADRQATTQLPLAVQQGCIPVFLGPPFHAMPMVLDVEYSNIALFIHMVDHTRSLWALDEMSMADGDLEPDTTIRSNPIEVPNVVDAINHLRNVPAPLAQKLHQATLQESHKFSYHSTGGEQESAVDIAIRLMCDYSTRMQEENKRKALERASSPDGSIEKKSPGNKKKTTHA
ncbi:hypothetical protein M9434_001777 [Picochlorum sp. BPE23]|nr:hypothetical protein M9434_001777 [Picochlorum sp. BPE23]